MRYYTYNTDRRTVRPGFLGNRHEPTMGGVSWKRPTGDHTIHSDVFGSLEMSEIFKPPHGLGFGDRDGPPVSQTMPNVGASDSTEGRRVHYGR